MAQMAAIDNLAQTLINIHLKGTKTCQNKVVWN